MKILSIGCGNMASAMIGTWLKKGVSITTVSPSGKTPFGNKVQSYTDIKDVPNVDFNFIFYMAKPQMVGEILPAYTHLNNIPWATVSAGIPIDTYKKILGQTAIIIRLMPNTPCAISQGVCPAFSDTPLPSPIKSNIETLLSYLGAWGWVSSEADLHTATALSGSGVAYIYYLIECMQDIAKNMGLDPMQSTQWAIQTVLGAGLMAQHSTHNVSTLRQQVTSPNGTTQKALECLMHDKRLYKVLHDTMHSALDKSIELSK